MIDESLLKSNFLGRDGFRWWIGQIAPEEAQGAQGNGGGWGDRKKVRILGYHPYDEAELSNNDLPWAQVLLPTTSGSGGGGSATSTKLNPADVVFGFFLDGDNAQIPVILGCFPRTSDIPTGSQPFVSPFTPFTGYTSKVKKPNGTLKGDETNENNSNSQKSPRDVPPDVINRINQQNPSAGEVPYFTGVGKTVVFANTCGDTALAGISSEIDNLLKKLKSGLDFVSNISLEIRRSVEKIASIMNTYIGQMMSYLYDALIPILQEGLKLLYELVKAAVLAATGNERIAHLAGVAAQTAMVPPVRSLEDGLHEIGAVVVNTLLDPIEELLNNVVDKVDNLVTCASGQFSGAILNFSIDSLLGSTGMGPLLEGVSKLTSLVGFDVEGTLRGGIGSIQSLGGMFGSNQSQTKCSGIAKEWVIGMGVKDPGCEEKLYKSVLENMNTAIATGRGLKTRNTKSSDPVIVDNIVSSTAFLRDVTPSDNIVYLQDIANISSGTLLSFNDEIMKVTSVDENKSSVNVKRAFTGITTDYALGDKVSVVREVPNQKRVYEKRSTFEQKYGTWDVFSGVSALSNSPCYTGPPVSRKPPKVRIFGGGGKGAKGNAILGSFVSGNDDNISTTQTASIIGVYIIDGGEGYRYPPYIEFYDESKQGYGAVGRAIIDTNGKVTSVYMASVGENYPIGETGSRLENRVGIGTFEKYSVKNVEIISNGNGYTVGDNAFDDYGNNYNLTIDDGKIISAQVINTKSIEDLPTITVNSDTGSGALLKPIIGKVTVTPPSEVTRIVDCPS